MKKIFSNGNKASVYLNESGGAIYCYKTNDEEIEFQFSLFSEVGEPFKHLFSSFWKLYKINGTIEIDRAPWVMDKVILHERNISTRIKNDVNGNPRYVAHFLEFVTPEDEREAQRLADEATARGQFAFPVNYEYGFALQRARKLGGRKFHNKQFGGGIVFQCYGEKEMRELARRAKEIKLKY